MRSIRYDIVRKMQSEKLAQGTPVCKTSRAFMFATLGESDDHIFLQRGYRQYGQMHVDQFANQERNLRCHECDNR
jgi:hypothetical protein